MNRTDWPARLIASPELLPFAIDPARDRVELRALSPVDYEKASFLDGRLEAAAVGTVDYAELAEAARSLPIACEFIFHIGHTGSTLMSRLLGQHPSVFSLREPQALRTLVQADLDGRPWDRAALDARLATLLSLYSRTWRPEQRALIKATSLVGELAFRLLELAPGAKALMMTLQPEVYLATILGGPNSRDELRRAAPERTARMRRRYPDAPLRLADLSEGELAAMSWVCEMAGLAAASEAAPERVNWIDFDAFLGEPGAGLARALRFLRGAEADAARLAQSPYLQRYSKAPQYAYGPEVRRETLAAARRDHAGEIARGLAWLEAARREAPLAPVFQCAESAITRP